MAKRYYIDESSKDVLDDMREGVREATRPRSMAAPDALPAIGAAEGTCLIGLARITEAGADARHWKWKLALCRTTDDRFVNGGVGSSQLGECVIANGGRGSAGLPGLVYSQLKDDGVVVGVTFVPIMESSTLFAVVVEMDGGADGDATHAATWTYTVKDADGDGTLKKNRDGSGGDATLMTPRMQRPYGKTGTALIGTARYSKLGALQLWWVDEYPIKAKRNC